MDSISVSFDDQGKLRVLDPDQFKQTVELKDESLAFVGSTAIAQPRNCSR